MKPSLFLSQSMGEIPTGGNPIDKVLCGVPASPIIVGLWRKTAEAWQRYGRRFDLLAVEARQTGHDADANFYGEKAANAYDHERRALVKALKLENGDYTEAA